MIILSNPRKSEWEIQRGEEREKKRVPCGKDLCLHPPHSLFSVMTPQSFFIEYWNLLINKQARMVHDVTLSFLKKKKKLEELERIYIMCLEDYIFFLFYNIFLKKKSFSRWQFRQLRHRQWNRKLFYFNDNAVTGEMAGHLIFFFKYCKQKKLTVFQCNLL